MLSYAAIFLGLAGGFLFNKNDACVISSPSSDPALRTQSVSGTNLLTGSEVQTSAVFSMAESSSEAAFPSPTSTYSHIENTLRFPRIRPSLEIKSSSSSQSVTPTTTKITASPSFPNEVDNCTASLLELKKLLEACVISTPSCSHLQPTQPVTKMNSSPQSSAVFPLPSTYPNNEITSPFSNLKSSPEITSMRLPESVTPSCTIVEPSHTISINGTNCTKPTKAMKDKFKNLIKELQGKTAAEVIKDFEDTKVKVYNDKNKPSGKKTVGIGFNMQQPDARKIWKNILPGVSFDDVLSGRRCLEDPEIKKLFEHTLKDKTEAAKRIFPKYDKYPDDVKTALLNGVFRGEFKKEHKTVKLINEGKWDEVPKEYLDRKDFKNCIRDDLRGLWYRMKWNAHIFRKYADKLKDEKAKKEQ